MIIYALTDSNGAWRYVGKTVKPLARRLVEHMREARRGVRRHVYNWIRSLASAPGALEVERCGSPEELAAAEVEWIAEARRLGVRLTNATDGGEGCVGRTVPPVTRQKISSAQVGKLISVETRKKISASLIGTSRHLGHRHSAETRALLVEQRTGRKQRPETVSKRRQKNTGQKRTPEQKLRMRLARWGEP